MLAQSPIITTLPEAINAGSAFNQQLSRGRAEGSLLSAAAVAVTPTGCLV